MEDTNSSKNLPRVQYMKDLQSTLANAEGRPIHEDLSADPTSVLCLADYGKLFIQCGCSCMFCMNDLIPLIILQESFIVTKNPHKNPHADYSPCI